MNEKNCKECLHFEACCKWTDFPKQCGTPVCSRFSDAAQKSEGEWINVDERLPEPNTHVLIYVFFHNQWQIVKGWHSYCDKKFHIANSDYPSLTDIPVTHWMPLPEAPKMKGGAE